MNEWMDEWMENYELFMLKFDSIFSEVKLFDVNNFWT